MLYIRSGGSGMMVLIEATPKGWIEKGRFEQPGRTRIKADSCPVISGGKVCILDQDILLACDVKQKQTSLELLAGLSNAMEFLLPRAAAWPGSWRGCADLRHRARQLLGHFC